VFLDLSRRCFVPDVRDHLEEVLAPERSVLVVVDLQNDYCHPDGVLGRLGLDMTAIDPMVAAATTLHAAAHESGVPVVFLRTVHTDETDSPSWSRRYAGVGGLCRAGTWGAEFYDLAPGDGDITVLKHRYSGFVGTRLENVLHTLRRDSVVFTGTATNLCVESTLRDAFMRDYDTVLVEDACAATDRAAHDATVVNVSRHFGAVATVQGVTERWAR
jgi:ureidoacrylate peracid hydrolase